MRRGEGESRLLGDGKRVDVTAERDDRRGGIGRAYNVALASLPNFTLPGDLSPSARYWAQDVVTPEWTMDAHGMVRVPLDRPGIGVEMDRARIEALTVRTEELRA
ncbi:MAG: hypothetical protein ACKOH8_04475 [Gemmatimonadota bacterium]